MNERIEILDDWYRWPSQYDLLFRSETKREADFLEDAWERYGGGRLRRVFEPGCGSGRLVVELARRG
ncbi:MAG TPA: hypothetical protein VNC50_10295, partial [Planctomycetia bacterium]|nr:hypothetical protein [Planctomycetia bacterium]